MRRVKSRLAPRGMIMMTILRIYNEMANLRAENVRLREALKMIHTIDADRMCELRVIAREALAKEVVEDEV